MKQIITNVANHDITKEVALETFKMLRSYLEPSFGPKGSNTGIIEDNGVVHYTKDGHTILKNIIFQDPIETSIKNNLEDLTRNIATKVGDGTTSAVILSEIIYRRLDEFIKENLYLPYDINRTFQKITDDIKDIIRSKAKDVTPSDIFNITFIATNGNFQVANTMKDIYTRYGNSVYINVSASPNQDSIIKEYDGLTLDAGYDEECYINTANGRSSIRNPRIFMFSDPIDTREMGSFLDTIINGSIAQRIPTVIMAPKISSDFSSLLSKVTDRMYQTEDYMDRPKLLMISNVFDKEKYDDLRSLCGAKFIRKYIDPKIQEQDIAAGLAPTLDNIEDFCGHADLVESDSSTTKIVNPELMKVNENGEHSKAYIALLSFLNSALDEANRTGNSADIHKLNMRIRSLQSSMVDYFVGGISIMDRDVSMHLIEDAVLSCASAAKNGYGRAANVEGLIASSELLAKLKEDKDITNLEVSIANIIYTSYVELIKVLLDRNTDYTEKYIDKLILDIIDTGMVFDVVGDEFATDVISSIDSDIYVLDTISKIVPIIATSNQFIVPDIHYNKYLPKN